MAEIQWGLLANLGKNFVDSYDAGRKRRDEELSRDADREVAGIYAGRLGGSGTAPAAPAGSSVANLGEAPKLPTFAQGDRIGQYGEAIAAKESGGRYDAVGPTHAKLGRALGKYQVMEANVAPWTREALGRELTPDEFLASPQAQDAVFQHRFGKYVAETGSPEDAASMWFTGRPLAEGANKRDVLGTTGRAYVDSFRANLARIGGAPDLPATKVAMPDAAARSTAEADLPVEKGAAAQFQVPGQPALPAGVAGMAAQIQGMLNSQNPYTRKHGIALAEKHLVGDKFGFQVVGDKLYRTDPRTGSAAPIATELKPTSDLQEYEYYRRQAIEAGQKPDDYTTWHRANKAASKTDINIKTEGNIPPGYQLERDEKGNPLRMVPIPGSPAAIEAQEKSEKSAKAKQQTAASGNIVVQDIDRVLQLASDPNSLPITGGAGSFLSRVPYTAAHDAANLLETVKANATFDRLQQMREASPTGGALGAVSDFENRRLAATIGSLEQSQSKEQFVRNLARVKEVYLDIVHGPGNRPQAEVPAAAAQPKPQGQAQGQIVPSFAAVPEGKRFRAPDGKVYRKVNGKAVAE